MRAGPTACRTFSASSSSAGSVRSRPESTCVKAATALGDSGFASTASTVTSTTGSRSNNEWILDLSAPYASPTNVVTVSDAPAMIAATIAVTGSTRASRRRRTALPAAYPRCPRNTSVAAEADTFLGVPVQVGSWELVDRRYRFKQLARQGLTTVIADGRPTIRYRGVWSIPRRLRAQGWVHIGDPGSCGGYVFDAYEGRRGAGSKLYEVVTPFGDRCDYEHALD